MATINTDNNFAVLVSGIDEDANFTPFSIPEPIAAFQAFSVSPAKIAETTELVHETYQRLAPPPSDNLAEHKSLLAAKDKELRELQALLSVRDAELVEVRSQVEFEGTQRAIKSNELLCEHIVNSLSSIEVRVADELAQDISEVLQPFVSAQLHQRILEEFNSAVGKCLTGGDLSKIKINGPKELIAVFRKSFADRLALCELTESETIDISAEVNNKLVSTRLDYWSTILAGR
jgi:hypothetical protein